MVDRVQEQLESIYRLDRRFEVADFVVQDATVARELGATGRADEELLVLEEKGELEVALYFAPALLERLRALESASGAVLVDGEMDAYCRLAEGVSHFLYLAWAAHHGRTVTLLELETQAEVDKFALCVLHKWNDTARSWAGELHSRLFERVSYLPGLNPDERHRYEEANRLSAAYCQRLIRHVAERRMDRLLAELRYSYRLGAEAKLRYLARAA
ncbi:MAG: hypothetical protein FJ086_18365 [Deltaproteobacteria bacterium]|nr:hypothetical protein [Deltaproteobacteria bacterium]